MATFGSTASSTFSTLHNNNRRSLSPVTLGEGGTLASMTVRARVSNTTEVRHWKGVIYSDQSGVPGELLYVTDEQIITSTAVSSLSANFAGEYISPGQYWIGYLYDSNATTNVIIYRANTASQSVSAVDSYADGPLNPAGTMALFGGPLDVYVSYSPTPLTVPTAPSNLTANTASTSRIDLTWQDNSNNESGFKIYRNSSHIATVSAGTINYSDDVLSPDTSYSYYVVATNDAGDSASSNTVNQRTNVETGEWRAKVQAWIYPGPPAENADEEYSDGRTIHVLKPEYFTVNSSGKLDLLTVESSGQNAYSSANATSVLAHCTEAYLTVSSDAANMNALTGSATNYNEAITTLTNFCNTINFHGIELDWEGFGQWTTNSYANYKQFVDDLADALHAHNKKLIIDGPPISNSIEQSYYLFKYEEFNASRADYIAVMGYDYQYDYGGGSAVSPNTWVVDACKWVKYRITDVDRIIMGMPSYGYQASSGGWDIAILTKEQISSKPGFATAARDSGSYEMAWTNAGIHYRYQDATGLNMKRTLIEDEGIKSISVWHLGGNDWFDGRAELTDKLSASHVKVYVDGSWQVKPRKVVW